MKNTIEYTKYTKSKVVPTILSDFYSLGSFVIS